MKEQQRKFVDIHLSITNVVLTLVLDAQKNRLIETFFEYPQHMFSYF